MKQKENNKSYMKNEALKFVRCKKYQIKIFSTGLQFGTLKQTYLNI